MASNPITKGASPSTVGGNAPEVDNGWPSFTPTIINETPSFAFVSPDPTEMANAWELPPNAGTLRLPTGITNQVPFSAQDRTLVSQSVQMVDLYRKLSSGQKLSEAEVHDASQLGGDIARAAQMQGSKNAKSAAGAAITEIAVRLENVGVTPEDLDNLQGAKVPPKFANLLQNSGYSVTKNMNLEQMLTETSGPKAQQPLGMVSQGMTVGQYVQGLGTLSKPQIDQLQQSMYNSGLYDSSYYTGATKTYTTGVLDNATILAFRNAMQMALKYNQPLESVIGGSLPVATGGSQNPVAGFLNQNVVPGSGEGVGSSSSFPTVTQATTAQTQDPLINAFESALGRAPSQAELQKFTDTYNQYQLQGSKNAAQAGATTAWTDPSTGLTALPGVPSLTDAATQYAENQNPVEYQAHGIAGAFGLLMNLVDRSGTSALDTPGHSPNTTS